MEFRVLGPLEVVVDGDVRTLPVGGERTVFQLLLLNAGRVVPANTLVDALWREDLPANAANALQGRVSRLRRLLADAGLPEGLVLTRRPGYLVEIKPDQVDAYRFARLIADARRAAARKLHADAASLYDEALALWRGDPLAELAGQEWADAEITRLQTLRLSAVEERIDLRLAAGQHAELLAELEDVTARHPLQERLHGQLMTALYRSGRQADALAVYQRVRRRLDDELGLEPSAEIRALEQAILRQDPKLGAPVAPAPSVVSNIPTRLTSFVGRRSELQEVCALVSQARLVTLTGPGGAGKTSLAIQVAARAAEQYRDGAWLVRLAAVTDATKVAWAVADALGVPDLSGSVEERLVRYLRDRSALLVLDNCEHLVDASAALAERLLLACPSVRLLATSREPLAVPGEIQFATPPLAVPPAEVAGEEVLEYESVALFVDRARGALPAFRLDETTALDVAELCRRLDGIPLAIELAAARVKTLSVHDIAARLDDRFRLLTAGARTAEARQQTLRAAVDWSHQLLTDSEKVLFRRLSVFRGGWSAEAAERVCGGAEIDPADVISVLAALVDRSVVVSDHENAMRFRMLETLRHYAAERLVEAGETDRLAAAHTAYFLQAAERGEAELRGPEQGHWLQWLRTEGGNLRAALSWCRGRAGEQPDLGLRLAAALGWFWYFASHQDGRHELAAMLAADGSALARARALQAYAVVARPRSCIVHPSTECAAAARESLELFTDVGDLHRAAMSRTLLAVEAIAGIDLEPSRRMLAEANEEFIRVGDEWGQALVLFVETELHGVCGALDEAADRAERALDHFRRLDDHWGVSAIQYHLGLALHRGGQLSAALAVYEAALAEGRRVGLANTVQYLLANIGHIALQLGDAERAERHFAEARRTAHQLGADGSPLASLGEGLLARHRGNLLDARRHFAEALHMLTAPETRDWAATATTGLGFVEELSGDLDAAEAHHRRAWRLATEVGPIGAGAAAVAVEGLACVAAARGDGRTAAALIGFATRWRGEQRRPASPVEQHDISRAADRTRALLGHDAFLAATSAISVHVPEGLHEASTKR